MTALDFVDLTFVNFRDHFPDGGGHGFRWVDRRTFRFPPGSTDDGLLTALLAHEQYRDDYAGGGVDPDGTRHGPYRLHALVSPSGVTRSPHRWALRRGPSCRHVRPNGTPSWRPGDGRPIGSPASPGTHPGLTAGSVVAG